MDNKTIALKIAAQDLGDTLLELGIDDYIIMDGHFDKVSERIARCVIQSLEKNLRKINWKFK